MPKTIFDSVAVVRCALGRANFFRVKGPTMCIVHSIRMRLYKRFQVAIMNCHPAFWASKLQAVRGCCTPEMASLTAHEKNLAASRLVKTRGFFLYNPNINPLTCERLADGDRHGGDPHQLPVVVDH